MTVPTKDLRAHVQSLKGSANLQATAHAWLRDHYGRWNMFLTYAALIPTAALLLFPLTTDAFVTTALHMSPNTFKILNALVALLAFVAVLIQMVWRPDTAAKSHRNAVDYYANAKSAAQRLLEQDPIDPTEARLLEEKYFDVQGQGVPPIPEDRFLRLKQWHLQKLRLSESLDQNPWLSLPRFPWQKPDA